jgi:hypothetical protein
MFFAPVESIERVMFRTGAERRFPDVDTPADWDGTLENAGATAPEASYAIANFRTIPDGEPSGTLANTPAFLRYDDYKHYVDDFNTMEGLVTADTWEAFAPQLPSKTIYNIIYGKPQQAGNEKIFILRGIANGLEMELRFKRVNNRWLLMKMTT